MRKIILGLVATAAIAAPLALPASANAATVDTAGIGTVAKGDVQTALGWNDAKMQRNVDTVAFTVKTSTQYDYVYTCSDGTVVHDYATFGQTTQPVTDTNINNTSAHKVTGWNLTGLTGTTTPAFSYDSVNGTQCAGMDYSFDFVPSTITTVQANGVNL